MDKIFVNFWPFLVWENKYNYSKKSSDEIWCQISLLGNVLTNFLNVDNDIQKCLTTNEERSSAKGKPCIYEWIDPWTNTKHEGCANPDNDRGGLWCPTAVDVDGKFVKNTKDYGFCNEYCLMIIA